MLALLTACSNSSDSTNSSDESKPQASSTPTTPTPTPTVLPTINAAKVVSGLTSAGYKCSTDVTYATCSSGAASVWVLTGDHPRPPVVSLHSAGPAEKASAAIAKILPQALEIAHINERQQITDWFGKQKSTTSAQLTAGNWMVDYIVEVDTDEPGVHLTLTDKLCKTNCQAE